MVSEGSLTQAIWRADRGRHSEGPLRFLGAGDARIPSDRARAALVGLVEAVLTRLGEAGVGPTPLAEEWASVSRADLEEEAFCLAAASLGCDPYALEDDLAQAIEAAGNQLDRAIIEDFFDAADPGGLGRAMQWVEASAGRISRSRTPPGDFERLGDTCKQARNGSPPWQQGYDVAQAARAALGLSATDPVDVDDAIASTSLGTAPGGGLQGLGGRSRHGGTTLVMGQSMGLPARRFMRARALWHVLSRTSEADLLITTARTGRQQASRAFAAELLAPAQGIVEISGGGGWPLAVEEVDRVAAHLRVSPSVVQLQIENQIVADDVRAR